ncbi:MAG: hypothetical protein AB7E95_03720 [Kiritimatiellales bacterium]
MNVNNLKLIDGSRGHLVVQVDETHKMTLHGEMLAVSKEIPVFEVYRSMTKKWDIPQNTEITDSEFFDVISKLEEVALQRKFPFSIKII